MDKEDIDIMLCQVTCLEKGAKGGLDLEVHNEARNSQMALAASRIQQYSRAKGGARDIFFVFHASL